MIPVAKIKYIRSLQQKKFRRQHGVFVAEGEKITGELIRAAMAGGMTGAASDSLAGGAIGGANPGPFKLECICAVQEWMDRHRQLLPPGLETHVVSPGELGRISGLSTPNQVLAVASLPVYQWSPQELLSGQTLVLDSIQDPGNMGTIIRTADWFGIRTVVCSPDSADVFSPKVIQSSMGSFLRVKTVYADLPALMAEVPYMHPVYGAFLDGENIFSVTPAKPSVLVIGNESRGISAEMLPFIDRRVMISGSGVETGPESLNASVAAGILMAWLSRERR